MHTRFLFLLEKEKAKTSIQARQYTQDYLMKEGFISSLRWGTGFGDWFVVGGRFSGDLTRYQLDSKKLKVVEDQFDNRYGRWIDKKYPRTKRQRQYRRLFLKAFPKFKGEVPEWRDQFAQLGSEDDAMIVNRVIYDKILKVFEGDGESQFHCAHDYNPVSESMINNYWVVVVDYHT